jgi:uncharacterized damage-inducible protein DinB
MVWLPYVQLIEIKRWADRGLCDAIRKHRDALADQDVHIMLRILDHIHVVDRIFQHHLEGTPHRYRAARSETLPAFESVAENMEEVDAWYAAYVSRLSPEEFEEPIDFTFTSGKPARMTRGQILLHISLHGTYHRGNAGAVFQLKGLAPGPDSITDYLEQVA